MKHQRLVIMIEISLMAALSIILSYVQFGALWAMGGSISLIMIPIFVIAFRRGWKAGALTGFIVGLLQLFTGATIVHPVQLVLEYPVAYTVLGTAGLFVTSRSFAKGVPYVSIVIGVLAAALLRFIDHFASGVIWFGAYAGDMPVVLYSAVYNASYLIPEALITIVIIVLLAKYSPAFFRAPKTL